MIRINILFPSEKRRIQNQIATEVEKKYRKGVKSLYWNHVGDEKVSLYVFLEDYTPLFVTAEINRVVDTLTICEDMSF